MFRERDTEFIRHCLDPSRESRSDAPSAIARLTTLDIRLLELSARFDRERQ